MFVADAPKNTRDARSHSGSARNVYFNIEPAPGLMCSVMAPGAHGHDLLSDTVFFHSKHISVCKRSEKKASTLVQRCAENLKKFFQELKCSASATDMQNIFGRATKRSKTTAFNETSCSLICRSADYINFY